MQCKHLIFYAILSALGVVQVYTVLSTTWWWFILVVILFWKIAFPLHSRSYQTSNKMKLIHVGAVVFGVLLPSISVVAIMSEFAVRVKSTGGNYISGGLGFIPPRFPPIPCHGSSNSGIFYSHIILLYILLSTGITFTFLVLWLIHKVSYPCNPP